MMGGAVTMGGLGGNRGKLAVGLQIFPTVPRARKCSLSPGRYAVTLDMFFEHPALLRFRVASGRSKSCLFDVEPYSEKPLQWLQPLYEAAFGADFGSGKRAIKRALKALHRNPFMIDVTVFLDGRVYPLADWASVFSLKDRRRRKRTEWDFACEEAF